MSVPRDLRLTWTAPLAAVVCALALGSCAAGPEGGAGGPAPAVVTTAAGDTMVFVPGGTFEMGSPAGRDDERPVHTVRVAPFLMDLCEVTQAQWDRLVLGNPSHFKGPDRPVEQISWADAALYCNKRSRAEGLEPCYDEETARCNFDADGYRLPTEAEWEYACRAGSRTAHFFGDDPRRLGDYAWYGANAAKKTRPVGTRQPNSWGLCDMYGNVAEWCNDVYEKDSYAQSPSENPRGPGKGERYVLRGGAWNSGPEACRSACRAAESPGFQDACFTRDAIGFRCVRRVPPAAGLFSGASAPAGPQGDPGSAGAPAAAKPLQVGLVYDDAYLRHLTGPGHPERPERLTAIVDRLRKTGLLEQLVPIKPAPAAREWLTTVHSAAYVARVESSYADGVTYLDTLDVPISEASAETAALAAGGVLAAVDAVAAGKVASAFCAVRPPGHHARRDKAMGFCIYNNVAIAARYAQKKHGLAKVLVVDWDVHHGNGTQEMFYDDPTVLYFGVHRYPFYPGTGAADEKGEGRGRGFTVNVPLAAGGGDAEFKKAFTEALEPAAARFAPDLVLISAGFDAHRDDPLGGMKMTAEGYADLTRIVKRIARASARGRIVSVLEGGYDLEGLAASVEAHLRALREP